MQYADEYQRMLYEEEAAAINEIQKGILAISQKENPFVFICYKETDAAGRRTPDSVLANDLYHQLTQEGFRVFFARITLEDKLGTDYEPYIFAALNSARVMVVLGTKPEHLSAVWVKNEWSRYLSLVKASGGKKVLIPAFRDMDPYDLPEEFSHLQALDMSKLGFMQDLVRGIKKITREDEPKASKKETFAAGSTANVAPLLKRAFMFLEDGDFRGADEYCERVLDQEPENAQAYLGKLMAELKVRQEASLADCDKPFELSNNYKKVVRFGDEKLVSTLRGYIDHIIERNENKRLTDIYDRAISIMNSADSEDAFKKAAEDLNTIPGFKDADELAKKCLEQAEICRKDVIYSSALSHMDGAFTEFAFKKAAEEFNTIPGFKDADELAKKCLEKAEVSRKDAIYSSALSQMTREQTEEYEAAIREFRSISGWRDSDEQISACQRKIEEIKAREEAEKLEQERQEEQRRIAAETAARKKKRMAAIAVSVIAVCVVFIIVWKTVIIPKRKIEHPEMFFAHAEIGSYVVFGSYEQDDNAENGKEDIEWLVLDRDGDRMLLISRYALDCKRYNKTDTKKVTWENCSLRKWLSGAFLDEAFASEEQRRLLIEADSVGSLDSEKNKFSPIFLLSDSEAYEYLGSEISARICDATAYAKTQGGVYI